jgi:hypothetical protein
MQDATANGSCLDSTIPYQLDFWQLSKIHHVTWVCLRCVKNNTQESMGNILSCQKTLEINPTILGILWDKKDSRGSTCKAPIHTHDPCISKDMIHTIDPYQ